jgi:WD40 repeat protein
MRFFFIPNLALPHWKPVFHYGYFIVPVVMGILNYLISQQKVNRNIQSQESDFTVPVVGALLVSLFVPSGVLLFTASNLLAQALLFLLPFFGKGEPNMTGPTPSTGSDTDSVTSPDVPWDVSLFEVKTEIIDLIPKKWGPFSQNTGELCSCYVLDEDSDMILVKNKKILSRKHLPLENPLGLHLLSETELIAIDARGTVVMINYDHGEFNINTTIDAPIPIQQFAVNSFGTMLAYHSPDSSHIHGFFIEAQRDQILARDISQPTKMVFDEKGRYLAVGSETGGVYIVDIATRKVEKKLEGTDFASTSVEYLCPGHDGSWVVAYRNQYLARWSKSGELTQTYQLPSATMGMDVASQDGQVAFGSQAGYIRIRSADFSKQLFKEKVHQGAVKKIKLEKNGQILISFDQNNFVHRVNLIDY